MSDRSPGRRPSKWLIMVSLAIVAGALALGIKGWYPSDQLKTLIWLPTLAIAFLIASRWYYGQIADGAVPDSHTESDEESSDRLHAVPSASASERRQHVLWPKGRMARAVRVGFALGCLLIAFSPMVCNHNDHVRDLRRGAGMDETSYFMRQSIALLFIEGGIYLVLGGGFGMWLLRRARGDWAQKKASLDLMGIHIFLAKPIANALVALPFIGVIYDTKVVRDPMSFDRYQSLQWLSLAVLFGIAIVSFHRARRRFKLPDGVLSQCGQCGYNLTGNTSGVCPECGTKLDA